MLFIQLSPITDKFANLLRNWRLSRVSPRHEFTWCTGVWLASNPYRITHGAL